MKYIPKKFLNWIVLAIVAYAYIDYNRKTPTTSNKKVTSSPEVYIESTNKDKGIIDKPVSYIIKELSKTETGQTVISALITNSLKDKTETKNIYSDTIKNKNNIIRLDKKIGTGKISVCGSEIQIHYEMFIDNNKIIDSTRITKQPAILTIGDNKYIKGLENGIIGMFENGKRKIAIPPYLAYDDEKFNSGVIEKNTPVIVEVELLSIRNGLKESPIIESVTLNKGKKGDFALCGDEIQIVIDNKKGKRENLSFRLGDKSIPLGFNEAIIGMNINQKNKVTLRTDLLEIADGSTFKELTHNNMNNITLEIELLSIK